MRDPNTILIVKLSSIGDVVHSLPLLEALKANFPQAKLDWLVEEEASQIIEGHPDLNQVIVSRRKSWQKRMLKGGSHWSLVIREILRLIREVRAVKYDLVIDLQGLLKSGALTGISRGKRKIGLGGSREGSRLFLNERPVPVDYEQHAIKRYLKLAEYLNCRPVPWKGSVPFFEADKKSVRMLLGAQGIREKRPLIAINPMARWQSKLWEPKRFAMLADRLRDELSCEIVFTGSSSDREIIKDISNMMTGKCLNLAGQTSLKELACLYTRCKALVSTDTGPMHIGAAMGCRVVALFGPTDPVRIGPYGEGHKVVSGDIECGPCLKKTCEHMTCMKNIKVERVFEAVKEILE